MLLSIIMTFTMFENTYSWHNGNWVDAQTNMFPNFAGNPLFRFALGAYGGISFYRLNLALCDSIYHRQCFQGGGDKIYFHRYHSGLGAYTYLMVYS